MQQFSAQGGFLLLGIGNFWGSAMAMISSPLILTAQLYPDEICWMSFKATSASRKASETSQWKALVGSLGGSSDGDVPIARNFKNTEGESDRERERERKKQSCLNDLPYLSICLNIPKLPLQNTEAAAQVSLCLSWLYE